MIIYVAAYPIHSFLLPIYSFWNMDNFTWGNTRIVVEERGGKRIVAIDKEQFDPNSVPLETWRSYAGRNSLPGVERRVVFDDRKGRILQNIEYTEYGYDMQDLTSIRKSGIFDAAADRTSRPFSQFSVDINRGGTPVSGLARGADIRSSRLSLAPTDLVEPEPAFDAAREAQVRDTIKTVLRECDLENMTKRQLRQKVEDILGIEFIGDKVVAADRLIDEELENLDDEASDLEA
jgi:chitin synthase